MNMTLAESKRGFLLVLPFLLFYSILKIFRIGTGIWGYTPGYLMVFVFFFYWGLWCLGIPLIVLGRKGVAALWVECAPLFSRKNWTAALVFGLITAVTLVMYAGDFVQASLTLIVVAVPMAIINGLCEEVLWRGMYVKIFPGNPWLSILYPAAGYAAWHIVPLQVFPETGVWMPFVLSTFFLGLAYGYIAYRTGSARWAIISHSLNGILALSGLLAPSILMVLSK